MYRGGVRRGTGREMAKNKHRSWFLELTELELPGLSLEP